MWTSSGYSRTCSCGDAGVPANRVSIRTGSMVIGICGIDPAHGGGLGGSRSVPRMPRRNGYCKRIQATDELLPCQS